MTNTDGARSSALRFTDDVAAPGHTHPGYARHFVGAEPEYPQVGDMWSTGVLTQYPFVATSGTVGGEPTDDLPDYTFEPNPFDIEFDLPETNHTPNTVITINFLVSVDPTISTAVPHRIDVSYGVYQWTQLFNRVDGQEVQTVTIPVTEETALYTFTGTFALHVEVPDPYNITDLSFVGAYIETSEPSPTTQWWDGAQWTPLGAGDLTQETADTLYVAQSDYNTLGDARYVKTSDLNTLIGSYLNSNKTLMAPETWRTQLQGATFLSISASWSKFGGNQSFTMPSKGTAMIYLTAQVKDEGAVTGDPEVRIQALSGNYSGFSQVHASSAASSGDGHVNVTVTAIAKINIDSATTLTLYGENRSTNANSGGMELRDAYMFVHFTPDVYIYH